MKYFFYRFFAHLGCFYTVYLIYTLEYKIELIIAFLVSLIAIVLSDWYWDWYILNELQIRQRHQEIQDKADKITNDWRM